MNTNQNSFSLSNTIELYGIKNLRVFMEGSPVDHSFAMLAGIPMGFTSLGNEVPMVEFHIEENNGHRAWFTPSLKYKITYTNSGGDIDLAEANAFANEKLYVSDFEYKVETGNAKIYLETEDGYHLIFGAYDDVIGQSDLKVLEWSKNVLNVLCFHKQV